MKTLSLDFQSNSDLVASKDLKYKLLYFGIHFGGASARGILAYAGADWTPVYPDNWGTDKAKQPFELIPVLTVIRPDNNDGSGQKELVLAENMAIDLFLAKQFGLHGENAWEEAVINAYYSHSNAMFFQEVMNNFFWESAGKSEEEKAEYLKVKLLEGSLSNWARIHEEHLKNNHLNGHYVGSRTTLADIRTTTLLDSLSKIIGKDRVAQVVNETATPGVIKVVKNVENQPSYKTWIESEEYKKLDVKSVTLVKEHHPELYRELAN
ncbi:hypothetical protein BGX34_008910 [Mortierella sp. NVP85]|nr:hypothetical protein BGX34_008910 [Mortierella sp. NVP85]